MGHQPASRVEGERKQGRPLAPAMLLAGWPWSARACASMRATSKGWFQHASVPPHTPASTFCPVVS